MPRYNLRTLLILLAVLPPLLAVSWWRFDKWRAEQQRRARVRLGPMPIAIDFAFPMPQPQPKAPTKAGQ